MRSMYVCAVVGAYRGREIEKEKECLALIINQKMSEACQIYKTEQ